MWPLLLEAPYVAPEGKRKGLKPDRTKIAAKNRVRNKIARKSRKINRGTKPTNETCYFVYANFDGVVLYRGATLASWESKPSKARRIYSLAAAKHFLNRFKANQNGHIRRVCVRRKPVDKAYYRWVRSYDAEVQA